jgi:hypothetical protein
MERGWSAMRGLFTINTPTERVPFGYVNTGFTLAVSPTLTRLNDQNDDEFEDDEEYEKEWCD